MPEGGRPNSPAMTTQLRTFPHLSLDSPNLRAKKVHFSPLPTGTILALPRVQGRAEWPGRSDKVTLARTRSPQGD
jgi:hypothetical protein